MDIGAIFLVLAVLILIVVFLAQPFRERRSRNITSEEHELSSLLAERDRLLTALQELDFDHTLGKIPAEEYPSQRADLLKRGAEILRQIDTLNGVGETRTAEDRVEAAVEPGQVLRSRYVEPVVTQCLEYADPVRDMRAYPFFLDRRA